MTNTGSRAGREVVQLYVRDLDASVARPVQELKAFEKVSLVPGQTAAVTFHLGSRDLSYWSTIWNDWVLEAGAFEFAIGASSRDLRLTSTLDVSARPIAQPLDVDSTLEEWLADPSGRAAIYAAVGSAADGRPAGILGTRLFPR